MEAVRRALKAPFLTRFHAVLAHQPSDAPPSDRQAVVA